MSNLLEEMQADALEAQRFSRKHMVLELDFSESSIAELEGQVDTVEYAVSGGKSPENLEMLTRIWGAYLGESLRRASGGEWIREGDGRLGVRGSQSTAYPHEQVGRRLSDGAEHNLLDYFRSNVEKLS